MKEKDNYDSAIDDFNLAYKFHLGGQIDEAIGYYKRSINNFPTAKAHTFLGWALSLQGKFVEAIDECKAAIELDPDFGNPYNDIGSYLIMLRQYHEAIPWLEKALDAPNYDLRYFALYNLGIVYEKTGDWNAAISFYKDALEINPDYSQAEASLTKLTSLLN